MEQLLSVNGLRPSSYSSPSSSFSSSSPPIFPLPLCPLPPPSPSTYSRPSSSFSSSSPSYISSSPVSSSSSFPIYLLQTFLFLFFILPLLYFLSSPCIPPPPHLLTPDLPLPCLHPPPALFHLLPILQPNLPLLYFLFSNSLCLVPFFLLPIFLLQPFILSFF